MQLFPLNASMTSCHSPRRGQARSSFVDKQDKKPYRGNFGKPPPLLLSNTCHKQDNARHRIVEMLHLCFQELHIESLRAALQPGHACCEFVLQEQRRKPTSMRRMVWSHEKITIREVAPKTTTNNRKEQARMGTIRANKTMEWPRRSARRKFCTKAKPKRQSPRRKGESKVQLSTSWKHTQVHTCCLPAA